MIMLINPRTSHNFIDVGFMKRKRLKTKDFEGFKVLNSNEKSTLVDHIVEHFGVRLQSCMVW